MGSNYSEKSQKTWQIKAGLQRSPMDLTTGSNSIFDVNVYKDRYPKKKRGGHQELEEPGRIFDTDVGYLDDNVDNNNDLDAISSEEEESLEDYDTKTEKQSDREIPPSRSSVKMGRNNIIDTVGQRRERLKTYIDSNSNSQSQNTNMSRQSLVYYTRPDSSQNNYENDNDQEVEDQQTNRSQEQITGDIPAQSSSNRSLDMANIIPLQQNYYLDDLRQCLTLIEGPRSIQNLKDFIETSETQCSYFKTILLAHFLQTFVVLQQNKFQILKYIGMETAQMNQLVSGTGDNTGLFTQGLNSVLNGSVRYLPNRKFLNLSFSSEIKLFLKFFVILMMVFSSC